MEYSERASGPAHMTAAMGPSSVTESGEGEGAGRESDAALCSVFLRGFT